MSLQWNKYVAVIGGGISIRLQDSGIGHAQTIAFPAAVADCPQDCAETLDILVAGIPRSKLAMFDAIDIAVGHPYANYMVLPWQDEIISPRDRIDYAESMLEHQYGIARSDWYCEISQERFDRPAIASAIRRDVVDAIVDACKKQKLRVQRVRALLADTIERHPEGLHDDAVFVTRQADAYAFAFRKDGRWSEAFTLRGAGQTPDQCLMAASMMANHFPANVHISDFVAGEDYTTAVDLSIRGSAAFASPSPSPPPSAETDHASA